jgi:23S rRNA pseudouridine1911/1915/1917 synthase
LTLYHTLIFYHFREKTVEKDHSTINRIQVINEASSDLRLDKSMAFLIPELSRTRAQSLISQGHVAVDGKQVKDTSVKIKPGQLLEVDIPSLEEAIPVAEQIDLEIVYEDHDLLVVNKPWGMVVHPAPGNYSGTLVNALLGYCGEDLSGISGVKRPGIVHRLDKDTSGLMVVAKTDRAHQGLAKQFETRTLKRTYLALILGRLAPANGLIEGNVGRHPRNRQKMALLIRGGKEARTHYKTLETYSLGEGKYFISLVECRLDTGRTHQIRVHLTSKGCPLLGDPLYGNANQNKYFQKIMEEALLSKWQNNRQALHAYALEFIHPVRGEPLCFTVPLPEDMQELIDFLKRFC